MLYKKETVSFVTFDTVSFYFVNLIIHRHGIYTNLYLVCYWIQPKC